MANIFFLIYVYLMFPLSAMLPGYIGWENGPVESAQNVLLGAGFVMSMMYAVSHYERRWRQLWASIGVFYLVLLARELSYGRVFFRTALTPEGPEFIKLRMLDSYASIYVHIGMGIALVVYMLLRTVPWRVLLNDFPFNRWTVLIAVFAVAVSQYAEHEMAFVQYNNNQNLEEISETLVYIIMLYLTRQFHYYLKDKISKNLV